MCTCSRKVSIDLSSIAFDHPVNGLVAAEFEVDDLDISSGSESEQISLNVAALVVSGVEVPVDGDKGSFGPEAYEVVAADAPRTNPLLERVGGVADVVAQSRQNGITLIGRERSRYSFESRFLVRGTVEIEQRFDRSVVSGVLRRPCVQDCRFEDVHGDVNLGL